MVVVVAVAVTLPDDHVAPPVPADTPDPPLVTRLPPLDTDTDVDDDADRLPDDKLTLGRLACEIVRAPNTDVNAVVPPDDAVPDTIRSALLSWVTDFVHPGGAAVCTNSIAVPDGNAVIGSPAAVAKPAGPIDPTSAPPAATPMVLASFRKYPVSESAPNVMLGADAVPFDALNCPVMPLWPSRASELVISAPMSEKLPFTSALEIVVPVVNAFGVE